eukprot:scpid35625/ scgid19392/ 
MHGRSTLAARKPFRNRKAPDFLLASLTPLRKMSVSSVTASDQICSLFDVSQSCCLLSNIVCCHKAGSTACARPPTSFDHILARTATPRLVVERKLAQNSGGEKISAGLHRDDRSLAG